MTQVSLRYKNETHDFKLPKEATLALLMNEIAAKLSIPAEQQKIICKGKPLKSPTEELNDGMKLLLMAQTIPGLNTNTNTRAPNRFGQFYRPQIIDTLKEPYHLKVINSGLPENYTSTSQYQVSVFPNSPIFVKNMKGTRATLTFESDAIFSAADDGTVERIFFSDIINHSFIPIQTHPGYYALGLVTRSGNKWFYFIPNQYQQLMNRTILSR